MTINFTSFDGVTRSFAVSDQAIDTTQCPVTLFGRGAVGYSQSFAQNLVFILENFASASSTQVNNLKPVRGQLWYNTATNRLMVNTNAGISGVWNQVGGAIVSASQPTVATAGDLWLNTSDVLSVFDGTIWTAINPAPVWQDVVASVSVPPTVLVGTVFITACPSGAGVLLPVASRTSVVHFHNATVNACNVFPQSGSTINTLSVSTAISLAAGAYKRFDAQSATQWWSS